LAAQAAAVKLFPQKQASNLMSLLRNKGISACLLSLVAWGALAEKSPDVQGETALIHINAAVVESSCGIALSSQDQSIAMQPVPRNKLVKVGALSAITWFRIELRHCLPEKGMQLTMSTLTRGWSNLGPVVSVSFGGPQSEANPGVFSTTGTASGIGLQLVDAKQKKIIPGHAEGVNFLAPGKNELIYGVAIARLPTEIKDGYYRSVIDFQVNYD
jgi:type 1 fimbria pilin